jgi:hypothetical protein
VGFLKSERAAVTDREALSAEFRMHIITLGS